MTKGLPVLHASVSGMQLHDQQDGSVVLEAEALIHGLHRKVRCHVARHVVADLEFLFLRRHEGHGMMRKPRGKS